MKKSPPTSTMARIAFFGLVSHLTLALSGVAADVPTNATEIRAADGSKLTVAGSGEVVMNLTDFVAGAGSKITFTGARGTKFVINVSGDFDINNAKIVLGGGVLLSDVSYNLTGTTGTLQRRISGNSVFFGALNVAGSQVAVTDSAVNGRKISGTAQVGTALTTSTAKLKPLPRPRGPVSP